MGHQAHGCGEAHPPGGASLALTRGRHLAAFFPVCCCVPVALQQVPGSSTQEAMEPRARWKSRAGAQLPTPRPRLLCERAEPVARPTPRAVAGPRVGGQGAGLIWVWRWGPQADGLRTGCSAPAAASPVGASGAQALLQLLPRNRLGHRPPAVPRQPTATRLPSATQPSRCLTPTRARAPGDLSNQQTAPSWASPVRDSVLVLAPWLGQGPR